MKSEWRVTAQFISRDEPKVYQVYRLLDVDATDQSGNREYLGGIYSTEEKAETVAKMSNGEIPFAAVPTKNFGAVDLHVRYQPGTRIQLVSTVYPGGPPAGTVGTVEYAASNIIRVEWDNGSPMPLIPGYDTIRTL